MGCKMCKKTQMEKLNHLAPNESEIKFPQYTSSIDSLLEIVEQKYNLLTYVQLIDYLNFLEQFSIESATVPFSNVTMNTKFSGRDAFLFNEMAPEVFQSFIENRILKGEEIAAMTNQNEEIIVTFKQSVLEIYKSLQLKLNQNFVNEGNNHPIKKINILAIGLLFCGANNVSKVKLIFDLFKNEKDEFEKSELLDEFLLTMFLISSYCVVAARNKASSTNENISKLTNEQLKGALNASELKDSQGLVEIFNNKLFKDNNKESYKWDEFKNMFNDDKNKSFGWILSTQGIRCKLEENNK